MNRDQFEAGILDVQQVFGSRYKPDTKEILWERLRTWDNGLFLKVIEVLPTKVTRLPATASYLKAAYDMTKDSRSSKVEKVHVHCDDCRGTGIMQWLRKLESDEFATPVARCDCRNGENFPTYPTMARIKDRQDFDHWLDPYEIPMKARMEAEGQEYLSKERQADAVVLAHQWEEEGHINWAEAAAFITQGKEIPGVDVQGAEDQEAERQRQLQAVDDLPF